MKIKVNRELFATMESVALTDIILNVFIFFFISFSLLYTFSPTQQAKIPVNLPKSETAEPDKKGPIQVTVTLKGVVYVDNSRVDLKNLKQHVTALLAKSPDRIVLLRADEGVDYGKVIRVLDQTRLAGAKKLGLAAEQKK